PDVGPNLLANGDFESPLTGPWTLTPNFTSSSISPSVRHGGSASLHVVATAGGTGAGNAIYQDITPALSNGQPYALSFWYLQSTNGGPLILRLSAFGVAASVDPAPLGVSPAAWATPGAANYGQTNLPA